MKRVLAGLIILFSLGMTVTTVVSCRETPKEKGDVEQAADDVGDALEDAADDVEDAIDEGVDEIKENTGNGGTDDN